MKSFLKLTGLPYFLRSLAMASAFFLTTITFYCLPAHAILQLELTQGIASRIPINIAPFQGQGEAINEIVQQDLSNSGYFKVTNESASSSELRSRNIDNLLKGSVIEQGDQYQVKIDLIDNVSGKHLLQQSFQANRNQFRRLAHHISDVVYEKLTGTPGIFSTRIAYVKVQRQGGGRAKYTLEVADADGYNPKPLMISLQPIMSPSWSPDGRKLAFVSFENRKSEIYVADIASGARNLITSFPGINGAPSWSPDGRRLALVLSRSGKPKIYIYDLAARSMQQVTKGSSIDTEPSWAPDGRSIIFTSDRGGNPQLYRLQPGSGSVNRITFEGNYNAKGSFTADGKQIAMLHRGEEGIFTIAVQDLHNERLNVLSRADLDESPSVSPNGKMILFATRANGKGVLGVVSTDGRVQLRLPARDGDVQEPAWSPYLG